MVLGGDGVGGEGVEVGVGGVGGERGDGVGGGWLGVVVGDWRVGLIGEGEGEAHAGLFRGGGLRWIGLLEGMLEVVRWVM